MSLDSSGIKIENFRLGKILSSIKNNDIPSYQPQITNISHTLTPSEFVNAATTGIIIDCTSSSKTITMPSAGPVISALNCKKYDVFQITLTSIANAPFTNTMTIVSSPSVSLAKNVASELIASAATATLNCVCYDVEPNPKIIIF